MEKDINVVLPELKPQLVVECYLEQGMPYQLTLSESTSFLAEPQLSLVRDAIVVISFRGRPDTLRYRPFFDTYQRKYYTHYSRNILRARAGEVLTLVITDKTGRKLTGTTIVQAPVRIDTIEAHYNDRQEAFLLTKFTDPPQTSNYYWYSVHKRRFNSRAELDYAADDKLNESSTIAFGSGYDFKKNDTTIVSLYHIEKQYYDFLNTVEAAREANSNPFAQPSGIKSTVQGGLGVFTNLAYDRRVFILKD
ncbi:DUF4249 domain-containing protein [Adhaeribacter aquaticus]|uniref:DUF4249 domain-containing protein n=1 Tax=Adhaeribacter aquaticus TaxID=299567 RepID=UPI00146FA8DF|nr:DUF4249 domain-containing protein [Adhaeribacter aquaticus]